MTVSNCMRLAASLTFSFMIASPYVTAHAYDGVLVAQVEDDDEEEVERDRVQIKPVMRSLSPSIRRLRPDPGSIKASAKAKAKSKSAKDKDQKRALLHKLHTICLLAHQLLPINPYYS